MKLTLDLLNELHARISWYDYDAINVHNCDISLCIDEFGENEPRVIEFPKVLRKDGTQYKITNIYVSGHYKKRKKIKFRYPTETYFNAPVLDEYEEETY